MVIKAILPDFAITWKNFSLPIFAEVSAIAKFTNNQPSSIDNIIFVVHAHDVDFNDRLAKFLLKKYRNSVAFKLEIDLLLVKEVERKLSEKQ